MFLAVAVESYAGHSSYGFHENITAAVTNAGNLRYGCLASAPRKICAGLMVKHGGVLACFEVHPGCPGTPGVLVSHTQSSNGTDAFLTVLERDSGSSCFGRLMRTICISRILAESCIRMFLCGPDPLDLLSILTAASNAQIRSQTMLC
jgi:hypothetical protein